MFSLSNSDWIVFVIKTQDSLNCFQLQLWMLSLLLLLREQAAAESPPAEEGHGLDRGLQNSTAGKTQRKLYSTGSKKLSQNYTPTYFGLPLLATLIFVLFFICLHSI